tara:strand:+ start:6306 stop:6893 length:588 start_codon:yes stop_codon:yes gene_type:complete
MRLLELFKGTGSVGRVANTKGYEVISLDIDPQFNPDICVDIMDFNYKKYPVGYFHTIWASPECKIFSSAQCFHIGPNRKYKNSEELDIEREKHHKFVNRVSEIIDYLKPKYYYIENPMNSHIKKADGLKSKPSIVVDYCRFGCDYKKPTRIWTNKTSLKDTRCLCKKHQRKVVKNMTHLLLEKYSIPPVLLEYIL